MPSILDGVRRTIVELLQPGTTQKLGERETLRQMYSAANTQQRKPNTWTRLANSRGEVVGYAFTCNCLTDYSLMVSPEWMRDYECPACRARFNLYKDLAISDREGKFLVKVGDLQQILAKLPVRPAPNTMAAGLPFIDPGGIESGEVEFVRSDPFSGR